MAPPMSGKKGPKVVKPKTDPRTLKKKAIADDHERLEKEIAALVSPTATLNRCLQHANLH